MPDSAQRHTRLALLRLLLSAAELWRARADLARVWWQYLILGCLGMLICGAWVYQGARSTGAMNIALIYAASPVLIALGAVLREPLGLHHAVGAALILPGVFLVTQLKPPLPARS